MCQTTQGRIDVDDVVPKVNSIFVIHVLDKTKKKAKASDQILNMHSLVT